MSPQWYAAWSPDTGTREIPSLHRGSPLSDLPTVEHAWWQPKPEVPTPPPSLLSRIRRGSLAVAFLVGVFVAGPAITGWLS